MNRAACVLLAIVAAFTAVWALFDGTITQFGLAVAAAALAILIYGLLDHIDRRTHAAYRQQVWERRDQQ